MVGALTVSRRSRHGRHRFFHCAYFLFFRGLFFVCLDSSWQPCLSPNINMGSHGLVFRLVPVWRNRVTSHPRACLVPVFCSVSLVLCAPTTKGPFAFPLGEYILLLRNLHFREAKRFGQVRGFPIEIQCILGGFCLISRVFRLNPK